MIALSKKQRACLDAILAYRAANGVMPSVEDLRVALALASTSTVFRLLRSLEKRRAIRRRHNRSRAISVLIGRCPQCGKPLETTQGKTS